MAIRPVSLVARVLTGMYFGAGGAFALGHRSSAELKLDVIVVGAFFMGVMGGLGYVLETRAARWSIAIAAGILGAILAGIWGGSDWLGIVVGAGWLAILTTVFHQVETRLALGGAVGVLIVAGILLAVSDSLGLTPFMIAGLALILGPIVGAAIRTVFPRDIAK